MKHYLTEAVNYSYYSDKLPEQTFDKLMELDPTKDLKYGRWIIQAYLNQFGAIEKVKFEIYELEDRKNSLRAELRQSMAINDSITTQRLRNEYEEANFKVNDLQTKNYTSAYKRFWSEDSEKVTEDLITYTKLKNKKKFQDERAYNILNIKTFVELFQLIQTIPEDVIESLDPIDPSEYEKWYQADGWTVVVPLTHRTACKYGANTRWCTASKDDDHYFKQYSSDGPLIDIIGPDAKWQLHFDSNQWMDELDNPIEDREKFVNKVLPPPVRLAIYERTKNFMFATGEQKVEIIKGIASDPGKLQKFQKTASYEEPVKLMEEELLDDLNSLIPDKFITWAIGENIYEFFYNMDEYRSEGEKAPWEHLNEEPENPDGLEIDTSDRYWKKDIDLWSEEQKERASDKAYEQGEDYQISDLKRNLRRYQRRDYGSTMNTIYETAVGYLSPENVSFTPDECIEFMINLANYFPDVSAVVQELG